MDIGHGILLVLALNLGYTENSGIYTMSIVTALNTSIEPPLGDIPGSSVLFDHASTSRYSLEMDMPSSYFNFLSPPV